MSRFAIVDVETTGFGKTDRVVELAVVVADGSTLEVVDEFETLLNPMRDIGASHIHGITPSVVEAAPVFEDVVELICPRIDGAVLVAHNLSFDQRFLLNEFSRAGVEASAGSGLCTLKMSGETLAKACDRHGIPLDLADHGLR